MSHIIHTGSNLDVLPTLPDNSVDAIVTDPPYELGFMGKSWDSTGIAYNVALWKECLRVLKPGGHLLAFSGSRTYHRMTCAIEDSGFEVRDQMMWVYGSGFPKSHNISKALNKAVGFMKADGANGYNPTINQMIQVGESSAAAKQWDGWGSALKPAHEPICLARKPIEGTVADNVIKWGVGGLNIDGCRVEMQADDGWDVPSPDTKKVCPAGSFRGTPTNIRHKEMRSIPNRLGRFPANLMHDGSPEVLELFPNTGPSKKSKRGSPPHYSGNIMKDLEQRGHDDCGGSAARFFYCPKASKADRDEGCEGIEEKRTAKLGGSNNDREDLDPVSERFRTSPSKNNHPTVKPTELMRYLCRLITPPGGTVLDPFNGSGSTGKAAVLEGLNYVGIEMNPEYVTISEARIKAATER